MSDSESEQKIREMARLSLMNNMINPIQEKNIKFFPFVFFNGVKSVNIDYDFSTIQPSIEAEENLKELEISYKIGKLETKHFRVSYRLTIDKDSDNILIENRFLALENSIRNLFWKETKVEIFINDELKYQSKD